MIVPACKGTIANDDELCDHGVFSDIVAQVVPTHEECDSDRADNAYTEFVRRKNRESTVSPASKIDLSAFSAALSASSAADIARFRAANSGEAIGRGQTPNGDTRASGSSESSQSTTRTEPLDADTAALRAALENAAAATDVDRFRAANMAGSSLVDASGTFGSSGSTAGRDDTAAASAKDDTVYPVPQPEADDDYANMAQHANEDPLPTETDETDVLLGRDSEPLMTVNGISYGSDGTQIDDGSNNIEASDTLNDSEGFAKDLTLVPGFDATTIVSPAHVPSHSISHDRNSHQRNSSKAELGASDATHSSNNSSIAVQELITESLDHELR